MADFDSIGEHDKPDEGLSESPDENIPLNPRGGAMGGSTFEPVQEQETSFGGMSISREEHIKGLYQKLSENIG